MRIISINGDTTLYGLLPTNGWEDALLAPAERKKITYNDNAGIDGSRAIVQNRKFAKRSITLPFYLNKVSGDKYDYYERLRIIEENLANGFENSGKNHLTIEVGRRQITYYLVYESIDKYQCFGGDRAVFNIKFVELNPNNRKIS